jgi:hypothetical protein
MPKVSRESATLHQRGPAEDRSGVLEGYTVNFMSILADGDLAPMLKGLPEDRCQCPHWGYMFKGELTITFADREETYVAGDAFHIPPGHTPRAIAGTEWLQFSPTADLAQMQEAMERNMRAMAGA